MLKFTQKQEESIISNRRAFNERQRSMAKAHGLANGRGLSGNAATLPRDVWGQWDSEAVEIARPILSVFNDLSSAVSTPMNIGKLVHHFQRQSDSGSVNISLDGRSKALTDQPVYDYPGTPLPIIDSTFSYSWRQVAAAQTEGFQLDAGGRANAMHHVAEGLENIVISGDERIVVGGDKLYGLTTHPKRNTRSTGETLNGATGAQWLAEVNATLKLLHAKNFRVDVTLYVNWDDWFYAGGNQFSTQYPGKTIAQAILETVGVNAVVPASKLPANSIVAVVKDRQTVQILNGMPMATRAQFRANPEDDYKFVTMASAALQIKYDYENQCGIAHSG